MKRTLFKLNTVLCAVLFLSACNTLESSHNSTSASTTTAAATSAQRSTPDVQRVELAQGLYQLTFSPRHNTLYVASAGSFEEGSAPSTIFLLDPATLTVKGEIPLERKGFALTLDDEASRLYVGNAVDSSITVVDTASNKVLTTVQLAEKIMRKAPDGTEREFYTHYPRELVLDKKNQRIFAPGLWFQDSVLYVVNLNTLAVEKTIPGFGFVARGAALDSEDNKLYVSNFQGQVITVDTATLNVTKTAEVQADQLINLAFNAQSKRLLATDVGDERTDGMRKNAGKLVDYTPRGAGNRVVVINPETGNVEQSIATGKEPLDLLIDEQRQRLYVTNRGEGTLTVYNSTDNTLLQTIALPAHPNSLALNPATGDLYVTIKNEADTPEGTKESVVRIRF
ncbi:YncE family protein [Alcaligenaceae bacterium 429]|nr:YncE family protein [Alcaligenaceae bacterium 429]